MKLLKALITFDQFVMPYALQFLFWSGIAGTLYGTWWLFSHDNWAWIMSLIFGPLVTRLIFESLILRYKTYVCMTEIRDRLYEEN